MRALSRAALAALAFSSAAGWTGAAMAQSQATATDVSAWTLGKPLTGHPLSCTNGKIADMDCQNTELLSYLPKDVLSAGGGDIWGWTDSTSGREFLLMGGHNRTVFIEVTDPVNPRYLGYLPLHPGMEAGPDVKVYKNYAFIAAEGNNDGMQVFDLTQLRDVKNAPAEFKEAAHYDNFTNAHTLTLNTQSGFAFPTGIMSGGETCGGGLHMIDIRNPLKPTFAGCYTNATEGGLMGPGYIHDALCLNYQGPDARYKGRELCLNSSGSAVVIVDVTDKKNVKEITTATYPNVGYAHQGWFTEDQRYFFLDDEIDDGANGVDKTRTIVFDLAKLDEPVVLTEFYGNTDATDHNLYINGRYMYQSNYTAGLRIVDIADPKNPKEVGFLDTAPERDGPGMNIGSWGNFPFLKNGVVANSDANGLFLVRLKTK